MITVVETFSVLGKSNIEGIEVLARQFHSISMNVKKKQCDVLAQRKHEFDKDFADFMAQIVNLEVCILSCCLLLYQMSSPPPANKPPKDL